MVERIPMWELKQRNQAAGQHWFEPGAMRFFRSKLPQYAYKKGDEAYFISSEQFVSSTGEAHPRKYSIRKMNLATGHIDTVGEFNELSKEDAKTRLNGILRPTGEPKNITRRNGTSNSISNHGRTRRRKGLSERILRGY